MSYNSISYLIYIPIVMLITFKVGWILYKNGEVFMLSSFKKIDSVYVKITNKLLLVGYYLINIGFAIFSMSTSKNNSYVAVFNYLLNNIGWLVILLAIMHYFNILVIQLVKYKLNNKSF